MDTLQFLYHTIPGRCVLKVLTRPGISKACGRFLDSDLSHFLIKSFADKHEIDLSEYELDGVRSFNDFFSREIKEGLRPIDMDEKHLIAPCDGLLSVWKIREETVLPVKQSNYTISSLLRNPKLAAHYRDGLPGIPPLRQPLSPLLLRGFRKEKPQRFPARCITHGAPDRIGTVPGVHGEQPRVYIDPDARIWYSRADGGRCDARRTDRKSRAGGTGDSWRGEGNVSIRRIHDHCVDW